MALLKDFLATEGKTIDNVIMEAGHMLGIVRMDSSSFTWLEKQEGIQKLDMHGIIGLRSSFSPWLFNQVVFLFLGMGFGDVEDNLTAYYKEENVIFFTVGSSGFYVFLAPIVDTTSQDYTEKR